LAKNVILCFILSLCAFASAKAQSVLLVQQTNGKPLANAMVYVKCIEGPCKSKTDMLYTAVDGLIAMPDKGIYEATIKKIGFELKKIKLESNAQTIIVLKEIPNDLEEFVVTGEYEKTSTSNSVQKVRVLDQKRIQAQGAVNLKDLLSNELNVRISQDNILGAGLSLQGISGQNIKILIDGVPVVGRVNGNIDLTQLNLNNIERVEIIEGPMSVVYGTDALGGVINLISKKPAKASVSGNLQSYVESVGQYNLNTSVSLKQNAHAFKLGLGRNYFNGFTSDFYYDNNIKPAITDNAYASYYDRKQQWLPKEQRFADVNYTYTLKNGDISYQGSYFNEMVSNKGLPTITSYDAYAFDDYYETQRLNNYVFLNLKFKSKANLNLIQAISLFDRKKNVYRKNLVDMSETLIPIEDDQSHIRFANVNFRGTYSTKQHTKLNYQLGYDVVYEKGSGDRMAGNPELIDAATFLSMEYKPINRLKIMPAARIAYNSRFSVPVVPSINVKYDVNALWSIRASYGNGFRAPSLKELNLFFFDFNHSIQGNQNLKAENSHNFNMVVNARKIFTKHIITFEPSIFFNHIYDMISLAIVDGNSTPPLYSYVNIETYKTFGLNLQGEWKYNAFSLTGGYTYAGRYNIAYTQNQNIDQFSYAPEYRINIGYTIPKILVNTNIFYKYNGALPGYILGANKEVLQTLIDPYQLMDATFSKALFKNKLQIATGIKNIFNITNITNTGAGGAIHGSGSSMPVSWGRSFFIQMTLNLQSI